MSSMKNPEKLYSEDKNKIEGGVLYLVATPIGNLSDMTYRAVKVLSEVDFIAAEDTRNSPRLLSHYGISKPLISYFEHNKRQRGELICSRLQNGESCALITDAGTPAISDPGEDIVRLCLEKGIRVTSIPGCCAAVTALTLSALPTSRFCFEGFLSGAKGERLKRLEELKNERRTMIFYEAPHKLKRTLCDMLNAFGDRDVAACRELTKLNEETIHSTLSGLIAQYELTEPRGEYVLIVSGAEEAEEEQFFTHMSEEEHVEYYINQGMSKGDAIKAAAHDRKIPKSELYRRIVYENN